MNTDALSRKKYRLKRKAYDLGARYSRMFRTVKVGDQLHMGEVYDIAHETVSLGKELEALANDAAKAGMKSFVFADISSEAYKLRVYSTELRKVSEAHFGFPVRTLPVYEPGIRQEAALAKAKSSIESLIEELEEKDGNSQTG